MNSEKMINYKSYDFVLDYYNSNRACCRKLFLPNTLNKNLKKIILIVYKNLALDDSEKEILLIRYIGIIKKIDNHYRKNSLYYKFSALFTSISSILVTAFISINNLSETSVSVGLWWVAWSLSLGISLINTLGAFFKWDRKYLLMFRVYYKLEQEIWMYLERVGVYARASHREKLPVFLSRIESIYKRVNETLFDIEENDQEEQKNIINHNNNNSNFSDINTASNNFIKKDEGKQMAPNNSANSLTYKDGDSIDTHNYDENNIDNKNDTDITISVTNVQNEINKYRKQKIDK